jgi:hypothetical protein
VARSRLIVGLITPHRIYLIIMRPVREAKARPRAMLCMYVYIRTGKKMIITSAPTVGLQGALRSYINDRNFEFTQ